MNYDLLCACICIFFTDFSTELVRLGDVNVSSPLKLTLASSHSVPLASILLKYLENWCRLEIRSFSDCSSNYLVVSSCVSYPRLPSLAAISCFSV